MYAIWRLSLKRRKQSPVNPFLLPMLNIPYVLPVPSLRKSSLVSSQHQYKQQPGQLYQTSCFLDWRVTKSREKSNSLVFDQLLLPGFEDGPFIQGDVTILWQAACDPSLWSVCIREALCKLVFRVSAMQSLCSSVQVRRECDCILRTEAGTRKHSCVLLHILLISGSKGPASSPAPQFCIWEAGEIVLAFFWRTLWLWWG